MEFNLNNSLPIWIQLYNQLKEKIVTGGYPCGSSFPTVRDLAQEAGVNPNTMQRAMARLEQDGLVITNRTAGRVVTDDENVLKNIRVDLAKERTKKYLEDMAALGYQNVEVKNYE